MAFSTGRIEKKFISSISLLDQREIMDMLVDKTNEELTFTNMMRLMGRYVETVVPAYNFYENTELYAVSTINGVPTNNAGPPAGTDVDVVLSLANGLSFPRVGDLVLCPNKKIGYVKEKTADAGGDILRIISIDGVSMALANTNKLAIIGQASGEGSGTPDARRYDVTKSQNVVQIFKESAPKITDIQNASKIEFDFKGEPYYVLKAQHDSYVYFQKGISMTMLFGTTTGDNFSTASPTITDADSNAVSTTKGVIEYITGEGTNLLGQTINLAFWKTLDKALNARRTGKKYGVWGGSEMCHSFDDFFNALGTASLADAARFNITGRDLELGINSAEIYGRRYWKTPMNCFDDPNTINFTGSAGYEKAMVFVPLDTAKEYGGGRSADRMRIRYMKVPAGNSLNVTSDGIYRETVLGGLGPVATDDNATFECKYHTIQGVEVLSASHFAFVTKA